MWRLSALAALLLLTACGRPLAPGEAQLARDFFGDGLNLQEVRVKRGLVGGGAVAKDPPLPETAGPIEPRPGVCDRVAPSAPSGPPPGWALYNTVHFSEEYYRSDTAPDWPNRVLLPQVFVLAHELVHVWQWQNRKRTGYRPAKAVLEAVANLDPYFYVPEEGGGFLDYGYEQQASLLEDYLCYGIFDPENPRRAEIRGILAPYFPVDRIDEVLAQSAP